MTVLEKIKRCVELVWDFEEIYDWSDIEAFCGAELGTYPQHDEILDYFKQIEALEKENAELKKELVEKGQHLTKAKELFERLLITSCNSDVLNLLPNCSEVLRVRVEAEQFLNAEVEK